MDKGESVFVLTSKEYPPKSLSVDKGFGFGKVIWWIGYARNEKEVLSRARINIIENYRTKLSNDNHNVRG